MTPQLITKDEVLYAVQMYAFDFQVYLVCWADELNLMNNDCNAALLAHHY
jgi:hypothetical protein